MRRLQLGHPRPALLPVVVAALVAPPIVGFVIAGPALGLAAGALAAAALVILAALASDDEPIEVSSAPADRYLLMVVAIEPLDEPELATEVAFALRAGASAAGSSGTQGCEVLVLAPALSGRVAHWLSDVGEARFDAQRQLALSLGTLAAASLDAHGQVGDPDPVQAVEDALRSFPASEVMFVTPPGAASEEVGEVRRRLDRPVRQLTRAPITSRR